MTGEKNTEGKAKAKNKKTYMSKVDDSYNIANTTEKFTVALLVLSLHLPSVAVPIRIEQPKKPA